MSKSKTTKDVKQGAKGKAHESEKYSTAKSKFFEPVLEISDLEPFEYTSLKPDLMKFEEAKRKFGNYIFKLYPGVDTIILSDADARFHPPVRALPQAVVIVPR